MTPIEAQNKINAALAMLKEVRNDLGNALSGPARLSLEKQEAKRMTELHDRAANAINAYTRTS